MNWVIANPDLNQERGRTSRASYAEKGDRLNAENKEGPLNSTNVVEEDSESGDGEILSILSGPDHLTDLLILDSACSYHMTPNKEWFHTYRSVNSDSVLMGNDASCKVIRRVNIRIKMFDGVVRTLCDVKGI